LGERANNIGTLRLLAALAVLFSHAYVLSHPGVADPLSETLDGALPLDRGLAGQGVAVFFVISGYLIAQSYVRRGNLLRFAEARILRIFPALICAVGVTILVGAVVSSFGPGEFLQSRFTLDYALYTATLLDIRQVLPGVFEGNPVHDANISLWTLPIELGMYGLVALAGVMGALRHRWAFNVLAALAVGVFLLGDGRLPVLDGYHDSELAMYFLAGTALFMNRDVARLDGRVAVAALAILIVAGLYETPVADVIVIASLAYLVMWLGLGGAVRLPDLAARGDLSYGTYLYACPASQLLIAGIGPESPGLIAILTAVAVLPVAWISWHLVEAPALRRKGAVSSRIEAMFNRTKRPSPEQRQVGQEA
jgi:peptidoglycan/LPS O-acetylase OafA/YrhL